MPWLSNVDRGLALGQLQAGRTQLEVAAGFGVSQNKISRLQRRYGETRNVADRPRSGRPRVTTPKTDRGIRFVAARHRFITTGAI